MKNRWQRIVSTTMAILVAISSLLVCAPVASASSGSHCKPAQSMKAGCSHCPQKNVMDCCATSAPQPAVPQDAQQQPGTALSATPLGSGPGAAIVPASGACAASAHLVRTSPPHGYRTTDLPILNAAFLI